MGFGKDLRLHELALVKFKALSVGFSKDYRLEALSMGFIVKT